uniref:SCP domain-containing protein n=1 Tax=Strongyloides papillosus TaxID=174720 RepID=A0A0N5BQH3_STREA
MVTDGKKYQFSYRDNIFLTKKDMLEQILKDHPSVDTAKILLLHIGTHHKDKYEESSKYDYEKPFPVFGHLKLGTIVVQEYYHEKQIFYYCINRLFRNYKLAVAYAYLMNLKLKFNPKKHSHVEIPDEINVAKKVGYYGYSNKIWRSFLIEMNEYRLRHGASLVKIQSQCTELAEKYLNTILDTPKKRLNLRLLRNYVVTPYYFAPLIVKKWYDESKKYKYSTKVAIAGTEHFTAMVWRSVKYVGFAVKEKDDMIHFVAVFHPLPNGPKLFSTNVKRKNSFFSG